MVYVQWTFEFRTTKIKTTLKSECTGIRFLDVYLGFYTERCAFTYSYRPHSDAQFAIWKSDSCQNTKLLGMELNSSVWNPTTVNVLTPNEFGFQTVQFCPLNRQFGFHIEKSLWNPNVSVRISDTFLFKYIPQITYCLLLIQWG